MAYTSGSWHVLHFLLSRPFIANSNWSGQQMKLPYRIKACMVPARTCSKSGSCEGVFSDKCCLLLKKCRVSFPGLPNPFLKSCQAQFTSQLFPKKHFSKHSCLPLVLNYSNFLWKSFPLNTLHCESNSRYLLTSLCIAVICCLACLWEKTRFGWLYCGVMMVYGVHNPCRGQSQGVGGGWRKGMSQPGAARPCPHGSSPRPRA